MVLAWPLEQSVCLKVLTLEKSETAFKACGDEPLTDDKAGKFNRAIGCSSAVEELDESGRLLLREDLTQRVGIKNEAVLVGCRSCFEIWAPETFEANLSDTLSSGAATAKEKNI